MFMYDLSSQFASRPHGVLRDELSAPQPACRETMLGVPQNNFVRKYEHYTLLTQTLARLPLRIYIVIEVRIEAFYNHVDLL